MSTARQACYMRYKKGFQTHETHKKPKITERARQDIATPSIPAYPHMHATHAMVLDNELPPFYAASQAILAFALAARNLTAGMES